MLKQVTQRVWCLPWEEERDRPSLYYIRGDRRSLAVDAGSSPAHVAQFYAALEKRGLPLPAGVLFDSASLADALAGIAGKDACGGADNGMRSGGSADGNAGGRSDEGAGLAGDTTQARPRGAGGAR